MLSWQADLGNNVHTAAGSQALFDASGSSWCGSGCGQCYELTSTGSAPPGQGSGGDKGQSIIVMVTNLCPNNGNAQWCPQPGTNHWPIVHLNMLISIAGAKNTYGYEYHFDIMASSSGLGEILGDNPVVNFTSTACPGQATTDFSQCVCASQKSTSGNTGSSNNAPAPAPSPSPAPAAPASGNSGSSSSGTAAHWAQCGGEGFTGPTTCASGFTCQAQNAYYSQCL